MNLLTRTPSRFIPSSLLIFALTLSGCGGGGGTSSNNSNPPVVTTSSSSSVLVLSSSSSKSSSSLQNSITPVSDPILRELSPSNIAYKYETVYFTLTGTDLVNGMIFEMDDCASSKEELHGGSSTTRFFSCSIVSKNFKSGNNKTVTFTDGVNGKLLGSFTVTVSGVTVAPVETKPQITSVSPLTAIAGKATTFTIKGKNLQDAQGTYLASMELENCSDMKTVSYSSELAEFNCVPMQSGTLKGSASNFNFEVNVSGQTPTTAIVVTGISPMTAHIHELTTFTLTGVGLDKTNVRCANQNIYPTIVTATQIQFQCKISQFGLQYVQVSNFPDDGLTRAYPNKNLGVSVIAAPDGYKNTDITSDIYTAGTLTLDKSVHVKGDGAYFYAINLIAGTMYSFDAVNNEEFNDFSLHDRIGNRVGVSTGYNHFGWTPSASGTYFLRAKTGSILTVKNEGYSTSNPYEALITDLLNHPFEFWLGHSMNFTNGYTSTTHSVPINIYKNETYEFEIRTTSFVPKEIKLTNGKAQEQFSFTLPARNTATIKFTASTSDTYYLQYSSNSDPGGQVAMKATYMIDSDHDGDPDSTDPFPFDPTKNSNTGNGNTDTDHDGDPDSTDPFPYDPSKNSNTENGNGNTELAKCASKPYTGDSSDPQIYSWDAIAQFDQCAYRATRNEDYVTDGNLQCKVLDGWLKALQSTFKPQYCNGPLLIK